MKEKKWLMDFLRDLILPEGKSFVKDFKNHWNAICTFEHSTAQGKETKALLWVRTNAKIQSQLSKGGLISESFSLWFQSLKKFAKSWNWGLSL